MSEYDALVVLGGGISEDGQLSALAEARVDAALRAAGPSTPIILSGRWSLMSSYTPARTEAEALKAYALAQSAPNPLYLETDSLDTIGNAYFTTVQYLAPNSWLTIGVVTSDFHILRAEWIFQKVLGAEYSIRMVHAPSGLSAAERRTKNALETKLLKFTKAIFQDVSSGDLQATWRILQQFVGYDKHPVYSREYLLKLIQGDGHSPDTYGLKPHTP